jgi:hypothetical protein
MEAFRRMTSKGTSVGALVRERNGLADGPGGLLFAIRRTDPLSAGRTENRLSLDCRNEHTRRLRSAPTDELGLVKAVDGFGERVVIAVADTADGWFDASLNQALGVFDRDILAASAQALNCRTCGFSLVP